MKVERGAGRVPLYQQVKESLRAAVTRGDHPPGARFVTEREVCERFGVSTTTAVRALNALVAEGLLVRRQGSGTFVADGVGQAAESGEASGSAGANRSAGAAGVDRADRPGAGPTRGEVWSPASGAPAIGAPAAGQVREKTVACILQGGGGAHVDQLLGGLESTWSELGYRMYLTYTGNSAVRETEALLDVLAANVGGIVLYPSEGGAEASVFAEVRRRGIPLVLVDRYRPDVATDAVVADNLAAGYEVTKQLIQLGHQRIATLWHETDCTSVRDRLAGHLKALRDHGIPNRPELTVLRRYLPAGPDRPGVVETLLRGAEPPTVLLCGNGFALAQAVGDLVALGREVPGDVDLAGMDDAGPFDILPLTAVAATLPSREIGERAARLLHERMASADPYHDLRHEVVPIQLRTRNAAPGYLRVVAAD